MNMVYYFFSLIFRAFLRYSPQPQMLMMKTMWVIHKKPRESINIWDYSMTKNSVVYHRRTFADSVDLFWVAPGLGEYGKDKETALKLLKNLRHDSFGYIRGSFLLLELLSWFLTINSLVLGETVPPSGIHCNDSSRPWASQPTAWSD